MAPESIDVLLQPLGVTIEVLEAPLARYQPEIIVLFTNISDSVKLIEGHLKNLWRKHVKHTPEIIVKHIDAPWRSETVQEYMEAFNEAVSEVEASDNAKGKEIHWHVGTAGGTNLMAVASAMSAFTHRFSAFYTNPKSKYPELADTPGELVIELPLFSNLGPAFKSLSKKPRTLKIMRYIAEEGPVTVDSITMMLNGSPQNTSSGMKPLKVNLMITESGVGWIPTTFGRTVLAQIEPAE